MFFSDYKYYVFGHYPSSCPFLFFFFNHNVLETGFCLRPQVKPTQLDPIDRASPYLLILVMLRIIPPVVELVGFTSTLYARMD
jgi:hypothetical protein